MRTPPARKLFVAHGGALGSAADDHAGLVMQAWWDALRAGEADALAHRLATGTPLHAHALRYDAFWQHSRLREPFARWLLELPDSPDALMASRSSDTRRKLRRADKLRRERLGDDLTVRCYREPGDYETIVRDVADVSLRSAGHAEGNAFGMAEHTLSMIRFELERGWYRAWVLYAGGRPLAWCDGELYRGTFFTADGIGSTGYDASPEYRDLSLGSAVMLAMFEDLAAERDAHVVDFGTGPWQYKRQWSNASVEEVQFTLFGVRPRSVAMSLAVKGKTEATRAVERVRTRRAVSRS